MTDMAPSLPFVACAAIALGALGCDAESTIPEPLPATAPACATHCGGASGPTPGDLDCIRAGCAPGGSASGAVAWRGLGVDEDPSAYRAELTTGEQSRTAPVARIQIRAVPTDALYASLVDAWFRCRNRVFHRAEPPEDWQIRFYAPERDLLAKWSWLDHRVVFLGAIEAGVDAEGRSVWSLPGAGSALSPSEAEAMVHDLVAVDVCGG